MISARWLVCVALLLAGTPALAKLPSCTKAIAEQYRLPVNALRAIHMREAGYTGARVANKNGKGHDRGLMQINTWWTPKLRRFGITPHQVRFDDCINVSVAAWILRIELNKWGTWRDAFAAYNAGDSRIEAGRSYAEAVIENWAELDRYAAR